MEIMFLEKSIIMRVPFCSDLWDITSTTATTTTTTTITTTTTTTTTAAAAAAAAAAATGVLSPDIYGKKRKGQS